MPQVQVIPSNPLNKLKKSGYNYTDFAKRRGFKPDTVRRTIKRYTKKNYWPRKNTTARQIVMAFFEVTKTKKAE